MADNDIIDVPALTEAEEKEDNDYALAIQNLAQKHDLGLISDEDYGIERKRLSDKRKQQLEKRADNHKSEKTQSTKPSDNQGSSNSNNEGNQNSPSTPTPTSTPNTNTAPNNKTAKNQKGEPISKEIIADPNDLAAYENAYDEYQAALKDAYDKSANGQSSQEDLQKAIDEAVDKYEQVATPLREKYAPAIKNNNAPSKGNAGGVDGDPKTNPSPRHVPSPASRTPSTSSKYSKTVAQDFTKTYTSFSGHDMVCVFELPLPNGGAITRVIGTLQTITYSIHNEKMPVRILGNMNAVNFVFGSRTIAGSLVFTVFDRHWAETMMKEYSTAMKTNAHYLIDEVPPFNITITMANEYGQSAHLALYGVTFVNEGQVMSINDIYTENTFQFYATDIDYLTEVEAHGAGGKNPKNVKNPSGESKDNPRNGETVDIPKKEQPKGKTPPIDINEFIRKYDESLFGVLPLKDCLEDVDNQYTFILETLDQWAKNGEIKNGNLKQIKEKAKKYWKDERDKVEKLYKELEKEEKKNSEEINKKEKQADKEDKEKAIEQAKKEKADNDKNPKDDNWEQAEKNREEKESEEEAEVQEAEETERKNRKNGTAQPNTAYLSKDDNNQELIEFTKNKEENNNNNSIQKDEIDFDNETETDEDKKAFEKLEEIEDEHFLTLMESLQDDVTYKKVTPIKGNRTEEEIIDKISGGDMTRGSCVSSALAYCGQKSGLDVIDFRGGDSQFIFATKSTLEEISQLPNISSLEKKTDAKQMLGELQEGKQYLMAVGNHAAIVKKTDNGSYQYLELQRNGKNGWTKIDKDNPQNTFDNRFGCNGKFSPYVVIDIEQFKNSKEFEALLGFINTSETKQHKGAEGDIK